MPRTAYVNGLYVPFKDATVHVEDRGFQLADGVYEVIGLKGGRPIDLGPHLDRLGRSLAALRMDWPMERGPLTTVLRELVRRNASGDGMLYLQVSRGVAKREHALPSSSVRPSLVATVRRHPIGDPAAFERGAKVVTAPDIRWKRCDIKTVGLLANVLGKQFAKEKGSFETWMLAGDGTTVTEGTSSNAWIVTRAGELVTHPADTAILNGITRRRVQRLAAEKGVRVVERPFTLAEALAAPEAFLTSTTLYVLPVVAIDGRPVGNGQPGPVTRKLREAYGAWLARGGAGW